MNYRTLALLIICIAAILIAGCTSAQNGVEKSAVMQVAPSTVENSGAGVNYGSSDIVHGPMMPVPAPTVAGGEPGEGIEQKIIKTADVSLQVPNVTMAAASIEQIATQAGGYVSTTNIGTDYNSQPTGSVELRIPAAGFDSALAGVKAVGTVTSISTQGQDVTAQYVDVQAQITAYQNQLAQYNLIMKNATKVEDVLAIQQQIDDVQTNLDRVTGQLKYLNSQVDYSTITVSLSQPQPVGGPQGHDFVTAINDGIAGFFGVIDAIIVVVISIIPLVIIGIIAYAGYLVWKRNRPVKP